MTKKITDLPAATTPLTGTETLPLVQGGSNARAGVGVAQVLQAFGDLPTSSPVGRSIYVTDAAGGARPSFWDGVHWRTFGGSKQPTKPMGPGVFLVGVASSLGPAHMTGYDQGLFFWSSDGFIWNVEVLSGMNNGFLGISYANGLFVADGLSNINPRDPVGSFALIASTEDPRDVTKWQSQAPRGYDTPNIGAVPGNPTNYDNDTGNFTFPISGVGDVTVTNPLPSAITPDDGWPTIGIEAGPQIMAGVGSQGPVEVRIQTTVITVLPGGYAVPTHDIALSLPGNITAIIVTPGEAGNFVTHYLQARKQGSPDWQPVGGEGTFLLNGLSSSQQGATSAGIVLTGLVWGPLKETAVQFAAGSG